jgi:hypothetical protein
VETHVGYFQVIVWSIVICLMPVRLMAGRIRPAALEQIDHGYALLLQARRPAWQTRRMPLLSEAVDVFKSAYQTFGQTTKVQALIGAAQCYLLMPDTGARWWWPWYATPLQRAERSLIQAFVLRPENPAAALLLSVVYDRMARQERRQRSVWLDKSHTYLARAAQGGMPVRQSDRAASALPTAMPPFGVRNTVLFLRYLDIRGRGPFNDLVFVYRPEKHRERMYGAVVSSGETFPLVANAETGALASGETLANVEVVSGPGGKPALRFRVEQGRASQDVRFVWSDAAFVSQSTRPVSP